MAISILLAILFFDISETGANIFDKAAVLHTLTNILISVAIGHSGDSWWCLWSEFRIIKYHLISIKPFSSSTKMLIILDELLIYRCLNQSILSFYFKQITSWNLQAAPLAHMVILRMKFIHWFGGAAVSPILTDHLIF